MPVVTRSQSKKNSLKPIEKPVVKSVENPDKTKYFKIKDSFVAKVKKTLADCESAVGKANKMRECKNVMKYNSDNLPYLFEKSKLYEINCWQKYAVCVYNKCVEFDNEYILNKGWPELDQELVREFVSEYQFTKKIVVNHIKTINIIIILNEEHIKLVTNAKKAIENAEKGRWRRKVPVVDYTGMDTIEPESEEDGITDIWYDDSYSYDSDYEPEEEEENKESVEKKDTEIVEKKDTEIVEKKDTEIVEKKESEVVNAIQPQPKKNFKILILKKSI